MAANIQQKTAQQIVDTVKDVCGQNVNFINNSGIIFASTDKARIGDFHEIGQKVVQTGQPLEVNEDNVFFGTQKGVNLPFQYNGEIIAAIGITGDPEEVRKYAYLAQKITGLIFREHELDAQNHNKKAQMNYIIHALITNPESGNSINHDYLLDFIKTHGGSLHTPYRTVVVRLDARYNPSNLSMIEQHIYQIFQLSYSQFYTFNYPNEYVLLMEDAPGSRFIRLFEQLTTENSDLLKIGIGKSEDLLHQYHSYSSAILALSSIEVTDTDSPRRPVPGFYFENPSTRSFIAFFDELDLEILLASLTSEAREHYLARVLHFLDDKEKNLLRTYFSCNLSIKTTCEKLFIHKNTLQYQLDKVHRVSGYNPRCFHDAVILYLAIKLDASSTLSSFS